MDLDEIEDVYKRELEDAEKDFLQATAEKKDANGAEEKYRSRIRAAREKYYKTIKIYLEKEKSSREKKGKKEKTEENKQFKVEPGKFELSWWEKQKIKWGLIFFKAHFKTRNKARKNTPRAVSYEYYSLRLSLRKFFGTIADATDRMVSTIVAVSQHLFEIVKDFLKKFLKYLGGIPGKIADRFKKKGKEEKKGAENEAKRES